MSERFPPGLTYLVQYDSTTFVSDTIKEVIKTLGEAFVLVVIVVFLFLGNLRATVIPAVAVPVSLIGAFAVLLALGYSANTVSLLAMVLAIGIVVDDAIVVVENVERVMEEEPELSPAEATKKAMAQITAPIIAISLVLLSVFVPIAFIPGISGTLFRQFAVTISAAMVISALNALTLSPALCAVFLRHTGPRRGIMGRVLERHRLGPRPLRRRGAAAGARRGAVAGRGAGVRRRRFRRVADHADRLPAGGGPGRLLHRGAIARRRVGGAHQRGDQAGRGVAQEEPRGSSTCSSIIGFSLLDGASEPNSAFMVARMKPFADRNGAPRIRCRPRSGRLFGAGRADPPGQHPAVQSAADHRALDIGRLRISARGAGRARTPPRSAA